MSQTVQRALAAAPLDSLPASARIAVELQQVLRDAAHHRRIATLGTPEASRSWMRALTRSAELEAAMLRAQQCERAVALLLTGIVA